MAFSIASIFGHNTGLQIASYYGYIFTWYVMCGLGFIGILLLVYLRLILKRKNELN